LLPHKGGWREANVDKHAYSYNIPIRSVATKPINNKNKKSGSIPAYYSMMQQKGDSAMVEAIKQAEDGDGMILRTFDSHGTHSPVAYEFSNKQLSIHEVDLMENHQQSFKEQSKLNIRFTPYEIKSYRLRMLS
jgi:alpha-mannosidase